MKNLERPVRVTHLLCSGEEETDKMVYADKFNKQGEANIKMVWEEWFWDCLEFGGRFDEDNYLVTKPRPQRRTPPPVEGIFSPLNLYTFLNTPSCDISTTISVAIQSPVQPWW